MSGGWTKKGLGMALLPGHLGSRGFDFEELLLCEAR